MTGCRYCRRARNGRRSCMPHRRNPQPVAHFRHAARSRSGRLQDSHRRRCSRPESGIPPVTRVAAGGGGGRTARRAATRVWIPLLPPGGRPVNHRAVSLAPAPGAALTWISLARRLRIQAANKSHLSGVLLYSAAHRNIPMLTTERTSQAPQQVLFTISSCSPSDLRRFLFYLLQGYYYDYRHR